MAYTTQFKDEVHLLRDGGQAFETIISCIRKAQRTIEIKAFVWRDDVIGNEVARAVLDAANRGVRVSIFKDRVAVAYEYSAGSRQSFFHKAPNRQDIFQAWFLGTVYRRNPKVQPRENALANALLKHRNVDVRHQNKRFDHTKVFVFDQQELILGSMGIGDAHHLENHEMAVWMCGAALVERYHRRCEGLAGFDSSRRVDFLVHTKVNPEHKELLAQRIAMIQGAKKSLYIEMAYWGLPQYTRAIVEAVIRGVETVLVTSKSDVLGDLNLGTCDRIVQRSGAPKNLGIFIRPNMVHTKMVVVDRERVDIGSANFTSLSHGVYEEVNAHIRDSRFAESCAAEILAHAEEPYRIPSRVQHRPLIFAIENAVVRYQGRQRLRTPFKRHRDLSIKPGQFS